MNGSEHEASGMGTIQLMNSRKRDVRGCFVVICFVEERWWEGEEFAGCWAELVSIAELPTCVIAPRITAVDRHRR